MKSFREHITEGGIEPIKPVVPIQPELPQKPKQPKQPKEEETPERQPDEFIPTRHLPEFQPYKGFAQYVKEFTEHEDYEGNTLFAIGPDGKMMLKDTAPHQIREHPDSFPTLNFGRPTNWEEDMGMRDEHKERPEPIAHGRIDHKKRMIQIITRHGGPMPYGDSEILPQKGTRKNKKDVEEDVYNRLSVLKHLKHYKHYKVYVSHTGYFPQHHTFGEHEKYLMGLLNH